MSKRQQQQQSASIHQSSGTEQAQGPATEDAGVAHAEQVGNGAVQDEMQGQEEGQSEAEGAFDWVVDKGQELVDGVLDVVDWGLEQLTSVEAVLTYVDTVGIEVAMPLLTQVGSGLIDEVVEHLAGQDGDRDLLWTLLDWLKTAAFLNALPAKFAGLLLGEALDKGAEWLLAEYAKQEPDLLLALVQLLDGPTLEELVNARNELAEAVLDATWPPGVGVELSLGASMTIASVAVGATYAGMLRHLGGGVLEGTFTVSGEAGLEGGVGEKGGTEEAQAKLSCKANGSVEISLKAADVGTWDGFVLVGAVSGGLPIMNTLDNMIQAGSINLAEMVTAVAIEGDVKAGGSADVDIGIEGAAANAGLKVGAAAIRVSDLKGEGDMPTAGTVELEFSSGAYAGISGSNLELSGTTEGGEKRTISIPLPELQGKLAADVGVRFRADVDLEAMSFGNVEMEAFAKGKVFGIEAEAALQGGLSEGASVEDMLASIEALKVKLSIPVADDLAQQLTEDTPLHGFPEWTGVDVQGSIELASTLDRETTRFIAEAVLGGEQDEEAAMHTLQNWARDPLGPGLGDARTLLCMELAQASKLEAKLKSVIEITAEPGLEVAAGLTFGGDLSVGLKLDYEADLLAEGAAPTTSDFEDIISRLGSEADTNALAAK